jgi:PhoPQ-activated pathogenicity-related protein
MTIIDGSGPTVVGMQQKEKSDGSTAGYYDLPLNTICVEDLIAYRNMNYGLGLIFKMIVEYEGDTYWPTDATMLQDVISYYDMNAQLGEIFRAIFRFGHVQHSEELRDAKKIKFYLNAELSRLRKYDPTDKGKIKDVVLMLELIEKEILRLSE